MSGGFLLGANDVVVHRGGGVEGPAWELRSRWRHGGWIEVLDVDGTDRCVQILQTGLLFRLP